MDINLLQGRTNLLQLILQRCKRDMTSLYYTLTIRMILSLHQLSLNLSKVAKKEQLFMWKVQSMLCMSSWKKIIKTCMNSLTMMANSLLRVDSILLSLLRKNWHPKKLLNLKERSMKQCPLLRIKKKRL